MTNIPGKSVLTLCVILGSIVASAATTSSFTLTLLWSTPISPALPHPAIGKVFYQGRGSGLTLKAKAMLPSGRIAFLGDQISPQLDSSTPSRVSPVLLLDAENNGLNAVKSLQVTGRPCFDASSRNGDNKSPLPYTDALAIGLGEEIWIGGF